MIAPAGRTFCDGAASGQGPVRIVGKTEELIGVADQTRSP